MLRNKKKAFTITELVIVIAVIAILAAVLIPTFSNVIASAKQSSAMQQCRNALTSYKNDNPEADVTGMVFVSNDHAFVYLNGALQFIGKFDDKSKINSIIAGDNTGFAINGITLNGIDSSTTSVEITVGESKKEIVLGTDGILYAYNINVGGTDYAGFFALLKNDTLLREGAYVANVQGFAKADAGITITDKADVQP